MTHVQPPLAKAYWAGTRKLLVIQSREVAVPERLLYIELIVVSMSVCMVAQRL